LQAKATVYADAGFCNWRSDASVESLEELGDVVEFRGIVVRSQLLEDATEDAQYAHGGEQGRTA
jgi:hypothetical protein